MTLPPKAPPRFVPTLTTVVDWDALNTATPSQPHARSVVPAPKLPIEAIRASSSSLVQPLPTPAQVALTEGDVFAIEEKLLHRVLQRIDLSLEDRLTEVVSIAVQQQLDVMVPKLRSEIETMLRSLVNESLSQELSEHAGSSPGFNAPSLG